MTTLTPQIPRRPGTPGQLRRANYARLRYAQTPVVATAPQMVTPELDLVTARGAIPPWNR